MTDDVDPVVSELMRGWGTKGGNSVLKKYGKDHFKKMGQKGSEARWNKIKGKEKNEGTEEIKES